MRIIFIEKFEELDAKLEDTPIISLIRKESKIPLLDLDSPQREESPGNIETSFNLTFEKSNEQTLEV